MSIVNPNPGPAEEKQVELCPFLGMAFDSQTSLSYPSSWNVCHHTRPAGTPNLFFQQSFCFSNTHPTCPIYTRTERAPIPSGIRFPVKKAPVQKRFILSIVISAVILLFGIVGIVRVIQGLQDPNGGLSANLASSTPTATIAILPTVTLTFTITPVTPTRTTIPTQPSLTSTPTGPTIRPSDTRWPSLTPTKTSTTRPTSTPTIPKATSTLLPTRTPRPSNTPRLAPTSTKTP